MKSAIKYLLVSFVLLITGCDIPGVLIIENKSNNYLIYREARCVVLDSLKIIEHTIDFKKDSNELNIMKGFWNHWNDEGISRYIKNLKYIEFICKNDSTRIIGEEKLYDFFKKHRRGLLIKNIVKYKKRCASKKQK